MIFENESRVIDRMLRCSFRVGTLALLLALLPTRIQAQQNVDLKRLEQKIQAVVTQARKCTVSVGQNGSGVVVSKEGLVLTCAHVTQYAGRKIKIGFPDGRVVNATTLGNYHEADAGLVRIDDAGEYPFAKMAKSSNVSLGDWVLATGYAVTFSKRRLPPVRIGRITSTSKNSLISDAPIMGGDSGGPLFNLSGEVIGVSSRVSQDIASNVHVPVDRYRRNWKRLMASEDWPANSRRRPPNDKPPNKRPPSTTPPKKKTTANNDVLKSLGIGLEQTARGAKVISLTSGSLAKSSGLRIGHIFVRIDQQNVDTVDACARELQRHADRTKVKVVVTREQTGHAAVTMQLRMQKGGVK